MTPADPRPQFTALAISLGGMCHWGSVRNVAYVEWFEMTRDGVRLFGEPTLGTKGGCFGVEIFAPLRHRAIGARTNFRRERALDRFGKSLGVTREFHVGEAAFDQAVFIDSEASDQALGRLLESPDVRRAIREILSVLPVEVAFAVLPATAQPNQDFVRMSIGIREFSDVARLERLIAALIDLARVCDQASSALGSYRSDGPGRPVEDAPLPSRRARVVVACALVVVPIIASLALPAGYALGAWILFYGYVAALLLWLSYGVIFALLFRGRSSSLGTITGAWLVALVVVPCVAPTAEKLNRLLDNGPPSTHLGTAQYRVPRQGSGYVEVQATWLPDSPHARAPNDVRLFGSEGVVPITAVTRPGAFGVPWLVSVHR